jgi:hypothetical protein
MPTERTLMWARPRGSLLLGLAGLTACLVVDGIALAVGAAAAGAAAAFLEPLAAVFIASAAAVAIVFGVRRRRREGAMCSMTGPCSAMARWWYRMRHRTSGTHT